MAIQGGEDRRDYAPLRRARYDGKRIYGTHPASMNWMNVENPQPGMIYAWGKRDHSWLLARAHEGWEVVPPDSPERQGQLKEHDQALARALGGEPGVRGDLVLLRIPEERYRALQEEKHRRALEALTTVTDSWEAKGADLQERFGSAERRIYYRLAEHGTKVVVR